MRTTVRLVFLGLVTASLTTYAQRPAVGPGIRQFVAVDATVVAFTHARVIDGTGAAVRSDQTVVIKDGAIASIGPSAGTAVPPDAQVIDLTGKTLMPGMVMVHEHLYYPTGPGVYGQLGESFVRLYLAGGVTTMRTGGNVNGFMDFNMKRQIEAGNKAGPAMDATAPYLNGPNSFIQMHSLDGPDDARKQVRYWAAEGATSFKAYMQITRAELGAAIEEAHGLGLKVTGHLCSVTYAEAADLGIDNLEHGFLASTDFVPAKQPDVCPGQGTGQRTIADLDANGEPFRALVRKLVDKKVTLTTTPAVFETFTPGRPMPRGLEVLVTPLREQFERGYERTAKNEGSIYARLFPKGMTLDLAFARAGGRLVAGTDPTGGGGVIPGFSNQRTIELLVEAGFTPMEAIRIATLNGAEYLGRTQTGSIAVGKQADLIVVAGDPSSRIADVRNVELVFKQGIGFDSAKLIASVAGSVGIW